MHGIWPFLILDTCCIWHNFHTAILILTSCWYNCWRRSHHLHFSVLPEAYSIFELLHNWKFSTQMFYYLQWVHISHNPFCSPRFLQFTAYGLVISKWWGRLVTRSRWVKNMLDLLNQNIYFSCFISLTRLYFFLESRRSNNPLCNTSW